MGAVQRGCGNRVHRAFSGTDPIVSRVHRGAQIGQADGFPVRLLARLTTIFLHGMQISDHYPYGGQARSLPGHLICAAKS